MICLQLTKRLAAVAAMVPEKARLIDVGTDHGYLPAWLVLEEKITSAIAADCRPGPVSAARSTFASHGMEEAVSLRQGDGLTVVSPGEVDTAVIAGMGAATILHILNDSPAVTAGLSRLVLQPMVGACLVRSWFCRNRWRIVDEELVFEDGRLYELIAAEPGEPLRDDPLLHEIGPLLWEQQHPLLREHLDALIHRYREILKGLGQSRREEVFARMTECKNKLEQLEEKRRCL